MAHYKYHDMNVLLYNAMIDSLKNYQFFETKMAELKLQVTRDVYQKLNPWSAKKKLEAQLETLKKDAYEGIKSYSKPQSQDTEDIQSYFKNLKKQNADEIQNKLENIDKKLTEIKKIYIEKKRIENKISNCPFKEKYGKPSSRIKELMWEKQVKEGRLNELCGTSHPFTKKGKKQLHLPSSLGKANERDKEEHEQKDFVLVPRNGLWAQNQNSLYKKETNDYAQYVKKHTFTKVTDEAVQSYPFVMCINNENPKLIPFEDEYAVMARTYQNLYNNCLNIDKDLMSVPEVRSKIQRNIINYFSDNMKQHPPYAKNPTRWKWFRRPDSLHRQLYFNDTHYTESLVQLLMNERSGYIELRDSTLQLLQENEKIIKVKTQALKQQVTSVAYSKFLKSFQGFSKLIQQVKEHPYLDLKPFLNDVLEKNRDSLESKIKQIEQYKDEAIMLYRERKKLETALKNSFFDKTSEEYNLLKNEKVQIEKKLNALCGTLSPFTQKGKQLIHFRINQEHLHIYNRLSYILSEKNSSFTYRKPFKTLIDQAQDKSGSTENQQADKKREEPETIITRM